MIDLVLLQTMSKQRVTYPSTGKRENENILIAVALIILYPVGCLVLDIVKMLLDFLLVGS